MIDSAPLLQLVTLVAVENLAPPHACSSSGVLMVDYYLFRFLSCFVRIVLP